MLEKKVFGEIDTKVHFFDVRVFNPFAPINSRLALASCYRKHEREIRREYDQRVREIEHGTFTRGVTRIIRAKGRRRIYN